MTAPKRAPSSSVGGVEIPAAGDLRSRRDRATGRFVGTHERIEAVLTAAEESGLLGEKSARVASRVSRPLLEQARERTGLASDSELIAFALANVALADDFAETYRRLDGAVDPDLKLGY